MSEPITIFLALTLTLAAWIVIHALALLGAALGDPTSQRHLAAAWIALGVAYGALHAVAQGSLPGT
ncbi:MAG: hypothetical protein M3Y87_01150 [Myxococcota bacterium]|nr:hypothetical protein [Myxococcota bacterium]